MKPFNGITHKDGGENDMIAFDNPDDAPLEAPANARPATEGDGEKLVAVDSPDDFEDEGEPQANSTV